uniref:Na/Pi cotransporter family protein n=1 Tax=candidate division WOR-3 bacterium TaxID=2052148 RepID=A0A7C3UQM1_UNCW3
MAVKNRPWVNLLTALLGLYLFFLAIELLGSGLKLLGEKTVEKLILATNNPFSGLFIGILTTSLVQSSSAITSIVVGMVGAKVLHLRNAIPIIMGANIGTTVTNTLVALTTLSSSQRLSRIFPSAVVHDFFNLLSVLLFFPLEISFHLIERLSFFLTELFKNVGGVYLVSPLKVIINPVAHPLSSLLNSFPVILLILSLLFLFFGLKVLVDNTRRLISGEMEILLDRYIFGSPAKSFLLGLFFTAIIQSSSVTTSLIIPLVAVGLLDVIKVYPYTLGANIGTTVTAILASFITGSPLAIQIAFSHLLFNLLGCGVWYPLRVLPIFFANQLGRLVGKRRIWAIVYVLAVFYLLPILLIIIIRR